MAKSVAQKMGIKKGVRAFLKNVPEPAQRDLQLPNTELSTMLEGEFDYIHLFTTSQSELDDAFPKLKAHLKPTGMLWVSWPKGKGLGTDLSLPKVIHIGYNHGLVESTCLSVNTTWSALKFTFPKEGKTYSNSYGTLPKGTP